MLLGKGDGTFKTPRFYTAGVGLNYVIAAKLDGDSAPDLLATDFSSDAVIVMLVGASPYGIAKGRFNGDHRDDLATANYDDHTASVLLGR